MASLDVDDSDSLPAIEGSTDVNAVMHDLSHHAHNASPGNRSPRESAHEILKQSLEQRGYTLGDDLGSGSEATVFRVTNAAQSVLCAKVYKLLDTDLAKQRQRKRLQDEFQAHKELSSCDVEDAAIVPVHEYFILSDDRVCLIRGYVEGVSLKKADISKMSFRERVTRILIPLFELLHRIQSQGKDLRDVSHNNFVLTPAHRVVLIDSGFLRSKDDNALDRDTRTNDVFGTEVFFSPEQYEDCKHLPPASAVYSMGILAHFVMFDRSFPFEATDAKSREHLKRQMIFKLIDTATPDKVETTLRSQILHIIHASLCATPESRPSAEAVANNLRACLIGKSPSLQAPNTATKAWARCRFQSEKFVREHGRLVIAVLTIVVLAIGTVGFWLWHSNTKKSELLSQQQNQNRALAREFMENHRLELESYSRTLNERLGVLRSHIAQYRKLDVSTLSPDEQRELAQMLYYTSNLLFTPHEQNVGADPQLSIQYVTESVGLFRQLLNDKSDDAQRKRDLAMSLNLLGTLLLNAGTKDRIKDSDKPLHEAFDLRLSARSTGDLNSLLELAVSCDALASWHRRQSREDKLAFEKEEEFLRQGVRVREELLSLLPLQPAVELLESPEIALEKSKGLLADCIAMQGRRDEASELAQAVADSRITRIPAATTVPEDIRQLILSCQRVSRLATDPDIAVKYGIIAKDQSLRLYELETVGGQAPQNAEALPMAITSYTFLILASLKNKDFDASLSLCRECEQLLEKTGDLSQSPFIEQLIGFYSLSSDLAINMNDFALAESRLRIVIPLQRAVLVKSGDARDIGMLSRLLVLQSKVYDNKGNADQAVACAREARDLLQSLPPKLLAHPDVQQSVKEAEVALEQASFEDGA